MQFQNLISKRVISIAVGAIILVILLILFLTRPGTVVINAEQGAEIAVSDTRGGVFEKIGTGNAKYKSRSIPKDVFIQVTKDGKKTISGASLERGKTKNINVKLLDKVSAKSIFEGSVSDVIFNGTAGQGIVPSQSKMINFATSGSSEPRAEFIGLPYMKKAIWYDINNFVYVSIGKGVGRFKDGENIGSLGLGSHFDGPDSALDDNTVKLMDVSKAEDKPLVGVSRSHLFLNELIKDGDDHAQEGFNMGDDLKVIAKLEEVNEDSSQYQVFSTKSAIYVYNAEGPATYASESDNDQDSEEHSAQVTKFDYKGKKISDFEIRDHSINAVTDNGNATYILTTKDLEIFKNDSKDNTPLYFEYVRDLINYKNRIILLADDGLWQISDDGTSIQLLYEFKESGVGLKRSLSVTPGGLVFGTQPRPNDSTSNAKTYITNF